MNNTRIQELMVEYAVNTLEELINKLDTRVLKLKTQCTKLLKRFLDEV